MVEMIPTPQSTKVVAIGYDPAAKEIHIRLVGGLYFAFMNTPPEEWDALCKAPSKGAYVNVVMMPKYGRRPLGV
jgi:hypothetical protein